MKGIPGIQKWCIIMQQLLTSIESIMRGINSIFYYTVHYVTPGSKDTYIHAQKEQLQCMIISVSSVDNFLVIFHTLEITISMFLFLA